MHLRWVLLFLLLPADAFWNYRAPITTEGMTLVTLDTSSLISQGKLRENCDDLVVIDYLGEWVPYVLEKCNSRESRLWVNPDVGKLYIYYGANRTFTHPEIKWFYDDFEDLKNWNVLEQGGGCVSSDNHLELYCPAATNCSACVRSKRTFASPVVVEWEGSMLAADLRYPHHGVSAGTLVGACFYQGTRDGKRGVETGDWQGNHIRADLEDRDSNMHNWTIKLFQDRVEYYRDNKLLHRESNVVLENVSVSFCDTTHDLFQPGSGGSSVIKWVRARGVEKRVTPGDEENTDVIEGIKCFEGETVELKGVAGETTITCGDILSYNSSSSVLECIVNGTPAGAGGVLYGCWEISCPADYTVRSFKLGRPVREVFKSGEELLFLGNDFVTSIRPEKLEGIWNHTLHGKNISLYSDMEKPDLTIFGNTDVVLWDECETTNYSVIARDRNLVEWGLNISGTLGKNITKIFCDGGNYTMLGWAVDVVGHRSQREATIHVGNASYSQTYRIPEQEFWVNAEGNYSITWESLINFKLTGSPQANLSFTVDVFGRNVTYNFTVVGPWQETITERSENDSFSVMLERDNFTISGVGYDCLVYNLSRPVWGKWHFKPPEYDPKTHHGSIIVGGENMENSESVNGEWWVSYVGNSSLVLACVSRGRERGLEWCGDGKCQENCHSCPTDCGVCHTSSGPGRNTRSYTANINRSVNTSENTKNTSTLETTATTNLSIPNITEPLQLLVIEINHPGEIVVENDSWVRVTGGLALSDGEKFYVGEFFLGRGTYEVVNTTNTEPEELEVDFWRSLLNLLVGILRTVF